MLRRRRKSAKPNPRSEVIDNRYSHVSTASLDVDKLRPGLFEPLPPTPSDALDSDDEKDK